MMSIVDCLKSNSKMARRKTDKSENNVKEFSAKVQGPWTDIPFYTIGWKAFQDLCAVIMEDLFKVPVEIYQDSRDAGQDAVLVSKHKNGEPRKSITVQVKFTHDYNKILSETVLNGEIPKIKNLKSKGLIDTYVLITNMSVSGQTSMRVKSLLRQSGIEYSHVFGKEFLNWLVRRSSRLRALVPRIYGLGDLSTILDERKASQTKALLGHLLGSLRSYVTTKPHRLAVNALAEFKLVLLLGDPASGKSTIAAILSTIASDNPKHRCYKCESPAELLDNWNPNESGGFYWIDDAFGPNQLREDYADQWISLFPKIQAAINEGNAFVLTSRRHIYSAAESKLGSRNHPLFRNKRAIVEVGALTDEERSQILYNHIKFGSQPNSWRRSVKSKLDRLADEASLSPEISRQLGDKNYTANLSPTLPSLLEFVRNNRDFLLQTLLELSTVNRAALTLIFLHRGEMPLGGIKPDMLALVTRFYNVKEEELASALSHLKGSFIVTKSINGQDVWSFKHPTLTDALAQILKNAEGMQELFLRGVAVSTILSDVRCEGVEQIENSIRISSSLNGLLVDRLMEIGDDGGQLNRQIFFFLVSRASDEVVYQYVKRSPGIFLRYCYSFNKAVNDPRVRFFARANNLGLLSSDNRDKIADTLEYSITEEMDISFLDDDNVLHLLSPRFLMRLFRTLEEIASEKIRLYVESAVDDADLELEPSDNFQEVKEMLDGLNAFWTLNELDAAVLDECREHLKDGIESVKEKIRDKVADVDEDWDWEKSSSNQAYEKAISNDRNVERRSLFSDIDD